MFSHALKSHSEIREGSICHSGGQYVISSGFKTKENQNKGGVPPSGVPLVIIKASISCVVYCSGSSEHCLSAGAAQGTGYNQNSAACGPHEVAIDTDAQGASELVIICVYRPSNCCEVAGGCVGAAAVGIKKGVCEGVFV